MTWSTVLKAVFPALSMLLLACRGEAPPRPAPGTPSQEDSARVGPGPTLDTAALDRLFASPTVDRWYGVYQGDRKLGYMRLTIRRSRADEGGAYVSESAMHISVSDGASAEATERRMYGVDGALLGASSKTIVAGVVDERVATFSAAGTSVTRTTGGAPSTAQCPASHESAAGVLAMTPVAPADAAVGQTTTIPTWDWEACADDTVTVTVADVGRRLLAGVDTAVASMKARSSRTGVTTTSRVGEGGVLLEQAVGASFVMRLEDEATARSGAVGLDILGSGVPVGRALGDPRLVARLSLKVRLPGDATLPQDERQQVTAVADGVWRVDLRRGPGAMVAADAAEAALLADSALDWREPTVLEAARAATAGLTADRDKAEALLRWVHGRLRQRLGTHVPSASAILRGGEGDCTEHSWLFVALLRAVGIPARPVYGLAYGGDGDQRFAYHAWAEVRLDGRWEAFDPTWGQAAADATHLKVSEDAYERLATVVGGITIEVLEVSTDPR